MSSAEQYDPKWEWIPCNFNLKTYVKQKVVVWNLQPNIVLTNPNEEGRNPQVKVFIQSEKSFQFTDGLGWNWNKSWNLPNISVRLEAHIFVVKAMIDQPDNFHLADFGIKGTSKLDLVNGQAFFQGIKFSQSSYNNEGARFHLVLCIYIMNEDEDIPKILNASISPPIFVESRCRCRGSFIWPVKHFLTDILEKNDVFLLLFCQSFFFIPVKMILREKKKKGYFVDPFLPEHLDKTFFKRDNKKKIHNGIQIFNNLEGLLNYLTAPNIRHKIKHPLFLALKFSSCVKLYYNTRTFFGMKSEELLESLQKRLTRDHCSVKPMNLMSDNLDDKCFILFIEESPDKLQHRKITEFIESVACPSLDIIFKLNSLPLFFQEITGGTQEGVADLITIYRKRYLKLLDAAKVIRFIETEEDDEDKSESEYEGNYYSKSDEESEAYSSQQPIKKVKPNSPEESNKPADIMSQQQAINASNTKTNYSGDNSAEENNIVEKDKPITTSNTQQQQSQQEQQSQINMQIENKKENTNTDATNEQQQQPQQMQAQISWNSSEKAEVQQEQAVLEQQQQQQQVTQQPVVKSTNNNSNTQEAAHLTVQLPILNTTNNQSTQSLSSQQPAQQQCSQQEAQLQQLQQEQQQYVAQDQQEQQQSQNNQSAHNQLQQSAQSQMQQYQQQQQQQQQQGLNTFQQQFNFNSNAGLNQQQHQQQQFMNTSMAQQNPQQNYTAAQVAGGQHPQAGSGFAQQSMMIPSMLPDFGMNPSMHGMGMMPMGFQMGQYGPMPGMPINPQFYGQMPYGYQFMMPGQAPQGVPQMMLQNPYYAYQMWGAPPQGAQQQENPSTHGFNPLNGRNQGQPGQQQ